MERGNMVLVAGVAFKRGGLLGIFTEAPVHLGEEVLDLG
jgi:hypothetical protein